MALSDNIKRLRKASKLTQKELAERTGLSVTTIQGYESGKFKPKYETIEKLASALRCRVFDIQQYVVLNTSAQAVELPGLKTPVQEMNDLMDQLNYPGQREAVHQVEQLTKIPEYKK